MNLHPIVVRENIFQTTQSAYYLRMNGRPYKRNGGRAIWSLLLIGFAVLYFGSRMVA